MIFSYCCADPDGNHVELHVDNFGDWAKASVDAMLYRVQGGFTREVRGSREGRRPRTKGVGFQEIQRGDGRRIRARSGARRLPQAG